MVTKSAMQELRNKLQIVIDEIEEDFLDGTLNQYGIGYKEAMVSVVKDIDAQMLTKEKQQIIDAYEKGDKYKFEIPGEDYYTQTYINETK